MAVIYALSNQPDLHSELELFWDLVFRKIAHMAEYFVLTYLLFKAVSSDTISNKSAINMSFSVAFLYAVTDEWHQTFIGGRTGSWVDVGIDTLGTLMMAGFLTLRPLKLKKV